MKSIKFISVVSVLLSASAVSSAQAEDKTTTLNPIVVTANPLGRSANQLSQPVTVLSGDNLVRKLQPTIGETLSQEPGIRSTYFGPNASRPVIRGLEGDQIQVLQNGIGNLDASQTSVDHNVAIDPLSVERIEVIRGPAALLYGSKAVGGVVNVIDNRIPNQPIAEKITGVTDARYNSANNERSGSILLEGGVGNYAWHVNGFKRLTDNVEIPGFANSDKTGKRGEILNSQSNSEGGTVGVSKFFKKGYFGISATNYQSNYGTVAEEEVTIDMEQKRFDIAGSYKEPLKYIKEVKYKAGYSDYEHTEFEGEEVGTVFENEGYNGRIEILHDKLGLFEGAIGLQSESSDFSALGEEAYLPPATTDINSAFIFEEIPFDKLTLQLGGRLDHQRIQTDQTASFGAAKSRDDLTGSGSLGFVYKLPKGYSTALSASYTQRAPNSQELYANGEHVATNTFENGDENLDIQQSTGLDLSFRKETGSVTGEVNFFYNHFQDFITLQATGGTSSDGSPIYNFVNLPAEFYGAEFKTGFKAYDKASTKLDFEIRGDYVEARNRNTGEPLARISPARIGGSAIYQYQKTSLRLDLDYTFSANHVPTSETKTDGYTMLNLGTDYEINVGPTISKLYLQATNLLDEEARNHVSFLKDQAPFAGRSIMIGIKTAF